ncbi:CatB-related O-acetyltransferase [Exiguobacterium sp. s191]|uniref:CatB-related O-acetyltransferase n=1 Tax=Exiguobacterium sp. s191 TaxID=2751196 RepID=UPI001BEA37C5|nr:CatB-related O-acetyltransferase [Exiguobacterium sp. s191]
MRKIINIIKYFFKKKKWRKENSNNFTNIGRRFPDDTSIVSIGKMTYGTLNVQSYGNSEEKLSIGSYCSIAGNVIFLLGGEHPYKGFSTYPFRKYICGIDENTATKGPIVIEDDVWIGENSLILSGVKIGQGAIIAAGSIVTKNIPPYAIFAAGKVLKYRFDQEVINALLHFDYENLDINHIKKNVEDFYKELNQQNVDEILTFYKNGDL